MIYHLGQGEDLWYCAEYFYGDASLWDIIYYANHDQIGDDPENMVPGMELIIPELEIGDRRLAMAQVNQGQQGAAS